MSFTLINVFYYNNQNKPGYIELYIIFIIFINDTEEVQNSQAIDHLHISELDDIKIHLRSYFPLRWAKLFSFIQSSFRYKGSNTGKRSRHPWERFLVSNEAPPSWRPIEIFPAGV